MHTIMLRDARIISYIYVYMIPIIYILLHINQCMYYVRKLKRGYLSCFVAMLFFVFCGAIAAPIINMTGDVSFILTGPFRALLINFVINIFLLLLYVNNSGGKPEFMEYCLYFACSNILYVLGTLIICAIPSLHTFFVTEIYMNDFSQNAILLDFYYTRIGWSGFSNYLPSALCSISVWLCIIFIFKSRKSEGAFTKSNLAILLLIIGNLCYARTGVIVSLICVALYILYLFRRIDSKVLIYPFIIVVAIAIGGYLVEHNEVVGKWYGWAFAQINRFIATGNYRTASVDSLFKMYSKVPSLETFLLGDGRYTTQTGYYMNVDIGWLRSIYYFGLFISVIQYLALIPLVKRFNKHLREYITRMDTRVASIMFFVLFFVFESKGEICFMLYSTLLPFCLFDTKEEHPCISLTH